MSNLLPRERPPYTWHLRKLQFALPQDSHRLRTMMALEKLLIIGANSMAMGMAIKGLGDRFPDDTEALLTEIRGMDEGWREKLRREARDEHWRRVDESGS